jgi:MOSC domain-containing protein YiiM
MVHYFRVLSVQTGTVQSIDIDGRKIVYAIRKTPVTDRILVTALVTKQALAITALS